MSHPKITYNQNLIAISDDWTQATLTKRTKLRK